VDETDSGDGSGGCEEVSEYPDEFDRREPMLGRFFRNNFMFSEAPSMLDLVEGVTLSEAERARLEEKSQAAREKLGTSWVHHPEYQPNPRHSARAKAT